MHFQASYESGSSAVALTAAKSTTSQSTSVRAAAATTSEEHYASRKFLLIDLHLSCNVYAKNVVFSLFSLNLFGSFYSYSFVTLAPISLTLFFND